MIIENSEIKEIGNLEFSTTEFKFKKKKEDNWHSEILHVDTRADGRIAIKVSDMVHTIDLNMKHLEELQKWIIQIEKKCPNNNSLLKLKKAVFNITPPSQSYLYVICDANKENPIYVGINHDSETKEYYWGSSDNYEPKYGDKKYIVTENLTPDEAKEMENYVIKTLRDKGFQLLNQTPTGNKPLCEKLKSLLYKSEYQVYIY